MGILIWALVNERGHLSCQKLRVGSYQTLRLGNCQALVVRQKLEVVRHYLTTSCLRVGSCQAFIGSCQRLSNNFQIEGRKLSDINWKLSDSNWKLSDT